MSSFQENFIRTFQRQKTVHLHNGHYLLNHKSFSSQKSSSSIQFSPYSSQIAFVFKARFVDRGLADLYTVLFVCNILSMWYIPFSILTYNQNQRIFASVPLRISFFWKIRKVSLNLGKRKKQEPTPRKYSTNIFFVVQFLFMFEYRCNILFPNYRIFRSKCISLP